MTAISTGHSTAQFVMAAQGLACSSDEMSVAGADIAMGGAMEADSGRTPVPTMGCGAVSAKAAAPATVTIQFNDREFVKSLEVLICITPGLKPVNHG